MENKLCTKCGKIKPLSEFHRSAGSKDGFVSRCKVCISEYQSDYYIKHCEERLTYTKKYKEEYPEKVADSNAKYYRQHRNEAAEYYRQHREEILTRGAKYKAEHAEDIAVYNREDKLQRNYGFTIDEYDKMLESQGNGCAICGTAPEENGRRLAVDHDHETGRVRGLLCRNCNLALGHLKDNPALCWWAMLYLEKHEQEVEEK